MLNLNALWSLRQKILLFLEARGVGGDTKIRLARKGMSPQKGRILTLFAHYDSSGTGISPVDRFHIESLLRDLDCDLVFCSTSVGSHDVEAIEYLSQKTIHFIIRDNKGYDFGSWKACMEVVGDQMDRYDYILLANNSVVGPFFSLKWLSSLLSSGLDSVSGMTLSSERQIHLQSYFVILPKNVFGRSEFKDFWSNMRMLNKKTNIVFAQEMGLSRLFFKMKVPFRAFFDPSVKYKNPTHKCWDQLIYEQKFPYLKKDLLRRKDLSSEQLEALKVWLKSHSAYDTSLIPDN